MPPMPYSVICDGILLEKFYTKTGAKMWIFENGLWGKAKVFCVGRAVDE